MTSVERAKCFLQRKARVLALTAVPLASLVAIAPTAKAGAITNPVLNPSACSISSSGSNFNSSGCSTAALPQGANLLTGVKMFGTASISGVSGGANFQFIGLEFSVSGSGNGGSFIGGAIPIDWKFTIGVTGDPQPDLSWLLQVQINGVGVYSNSFSAAPGVIAGNDVTSVVPAGPITSYQINFLVSDDEALPNETLTVTVPQNSININTAAITAGVPEPGTFALLGSALVGLGAFAWRRRT
jgi:PEP-CTERM motif